MEDPDVAKVLYSERAIADRVAALGVELAAEYADKAPVVLPVMTGAMCFCSDLLRAMRPSPRGTQVESIKSKSYFGNRSTGNVKVHPIEIDVEGRHVLLVEDIVDTGLTIAKLKEHAEQAGAASVKMVALLNKGARRVNDMQPEWTGFECEDEFVIGYGMDFDGAYGSSRTSACSNRRCTAAAIRRGHQDQGQEAQELSRTRGGSAALLVARAHVIDIVHVDDIFPRGFDARRRETRDVEAEET